MCAQKYIIKRTSPPKFGDKAGQAYDFGPDLYWVTIQLDKVPENDWIILFRDPLLGEFSKFEDNEVYPKRLQIDGNKITWKTTRDKVKSNIDDLDRYIGQTNENYNIELKKQEEKKRQQNELEKKKKQELDKLNDEFKDL
jgi:hypothetical protein